MTHDQDQGQDFVSKFFLWQGLLWQGLVQVLLSELIKHTVGLILLKKANVQFMLPVYLQYCP